MLLAASLFWWLYFDLKDRVQPEPRHKLIAAFGLGVIAASLAMGVFEVLDRLGVPPLQGGANAWTAVYCFGLIGPVEEGAKFLVAATCVLRWKEFDELIDGLVYPAAIALGFAALENLVQVGGLPLGQQLARSFALPLTHSLFAAVWGYGLAYAHLRVPRGWRRYALQGGFLLLAMGLHGLYDFLIFAYQATFAVAILGLALWMAMIWRARLALAK